jgi:hypothetical protein
MSHYAEFLVAPEILTRDAFTPKTVIEFVCVAKERLATAGTTEDRAAPDDRRGT